MYFPNGEEFSGIIEVEGFKFRKHVTRRDDYILIEITDMANTVIVETKVYDLSEVEHMEEVLSSEIYDYIENKTDELDKIMAHFIKN